MSDNKQLFQCHQNCNDELQKKIYAAISTLAGSIENIYFQQDATRRIEPGKFSSEEPLKHRFLMSFVIPCPHDNCSQMDTQTSQNLTPVYNTAYDKNSNEIVTISTVSLPELKMPYLTLLDPSAEDRPSGKECDNQNFQESSSDLETTQVVSLEECKIEIENENDFQNNYMQTEAEEDFSDLQLIDYQTGCFPLSSELLHAAINEQLDKACPKADWQTPLFNDVTGTPSDQIAHLTFEKPQGSPEPQSSEVSSTQQLFINSNQINYTPNVTVTTVPIESASESRPMAMASHASFNLVMNSTSSLCPATLPTVSSLVANAGSSMNWQLSRCGTKFPIQGAFQMANKASYTTTRPLVLVPKKVGSGLFGTGQGATLPQTSVKQRCRKINPAQKIIYVDTEQEEPKPPSPEPKSQFADLPRTDNVPAGHSYESWILEEGLHKIRKGRLHRNDDKTGYPYSCPICTKRYKNPNGIKYHARYAHGPKSVFQCEICKREYSTKHGLTAHKKSHLVSLSAPPEIINGGFVNANVPNTVLITSVSN